jgi:hypothetical protein
VYDRGEFVDFARESRVQLKRLGQLQFYVPDLLLLRPEATQRGLEVSFGAVRRSPHEKSDIQLRDRRYQVSGKLKAVPVNHLGKKVAFALTRCRAKISVQPTTIHIQMKMFRGVPIP